MDDDDEWAELFAKAEGGGTTTTTTEITTNTTTTTTTTTTSTHTTVAHHHHNHRRNDDIHSDIDDYDDGRRNNDNNNKKNNNKKRKRKRSQGQQRQQNQLQHEYCLDDEDDDQRMSSKLEWPSWLILNDGIFIANNNNNNKSASSSVCPGWKGSILSLSSRCENCFQPASYHLASVADYNLHHRLRRCRRFFCFIRNLRCISIRIIVDFNNREDEDKHNDEKVAVVSLFGKLEEEWRELLEKVLADVELSSSITSKFEALGPLIRTAKKKCRNKKEAKQKKKKKSHNNNTSTTAAATTAIDEAMIRLIMGCDDVYYQLYYDQITNAATANATAKYHVIPHPPSYFGLVGGGGAISIDYSTTNLMMDTEKLGNKKKTDDEISDRFGLKNDPLREHPLSAIHHYRFLETQILFDRWSITRSSSTSSIANLNVTREDDDTTTALVQHETPAPALLADWRDSCRDFVCHLYAYVTVSQSVLSQLLKVLHEEYKIRDVIDLGAGTGYLASCLQRILAQQRNHSMNVQAYDIHPTPPPSSVLASAANGVVANEYHGSVPSFCLVSEGNQEILTKLKKHLDETALMLCYPPPQSEFARNALSKFVQRDGKVVVFIGEFKGLTGSKEFERMLVTKFRVVQRFPCLCWGTDAAIVTVWIRRQATTTATDHSSNKNNKSLLLPCSYCGDKESVKRFRWLRYLSYCSRGCCQRDYVARCANLRMVMIVNGIDEGGGGGDDDTKKKSKAFLFDDDFDNNEAYSQL